MADTKLVPCPFCGKVDFRYDAVPQRHSAYSRFAGKARMMCGCGAEGPPSTDNPVGKWNTRTPDPRLAAAQGLADALKGLENCVMREGIERTSDPDEKRSAGAFIALMDAIRVARAALTAWEKAVR